MLDPSTLRETMPGCARHDCALCRDIPKKLSADYLLGEDDPRWLKELVSLGADRCLELLACPRCGRLYLRTERQEYMDGLHCETVGLGVKGITGEEAAALLEKWDRDPDWHQRHKKMRLARLPRVAKGVPNFDA